jgi:tripartite-type tricarboxylate transporter receptor subunit TctC
MGGKMEHLLHHQKSVLAAYKLSIAKNYHSHSIFHFIKNLLQAQFNLIKSFFIGIMLIIACMNISSAQPVTSYYHGKTINIIVGFGPGGGYDLYARLLSRFIGDHINGHPSIIVQNMDGAGSVRAANYVYNTATKDGTTIAAVNQNMPMYSLLGGKAAQFDAQKLVWLGSMGGSNGVLYTWHTSKVKTIDDAKKYETSLGGAGTNSDSYIFPTLINNLIHTKFKVINGYPGGSKEIHIAMERGEVDGRGGNSWSSLTSTNQEWVSNKKINILIQIGFKREAALPEVPLLQELVATEEDKKIVDLASLPTVLGYAHWMSPDVSMDRIIELRKAYFDTMKDVNLLSEAKKLMMPINPIKGEELAEMVSVVSNTPPNIIQKAAEKLEWKD